MRNKSVYGLQYPQRPVRTCYALIGLCGVRRPGLDEGNIVYILICQSYKKVRNEVLDRVGALNT